ncbi:MAG: polyphosphate kinase 1 [Erysipelothrix sp.]|nr:polyphosphate kinase 1 [Erysipelothrix sp.]
MNLFINLELSWLEFNKRVLYQALDEDTPLLEKLGFLSIYGNNLDEFFMVRIGSLSDQMIAIPNKIDEKTGDNAAQQIEKVEQWLFDHDKEVEKVIKKVLSQLSQTGIHFVNFKNLDKVDQLLTKKYFNNEIKPLLSAQIIDPHHPFPFLKNKSSYVMALLEDKATQVKYGIVPTDSLPKFLNYSINNQERIVLVDELIKMYLANLFKKYTVKEVVTLRVTRNADIDIGGEMMDDHFDFVDIMEKLLKKRKRLGIVRVQLSGPISIEFQNYLIKELEISLRHIVINQYPLDLSFGFAIRKTFKESRSQDIYPTVSPVVSLDFANKSGMEYINYKDVLLSYPYQSSQPFTQLIYEAANNPDVVSIKITLYRLASPSRLAAALVYAAEKGKQVIAILELRARFDEQSNIDYSKMLEDAGCIVLYGLTDYKVHSKICLITLRKPSGVRYITYIGTGNFNESTQEQYTDLAYITANQFVGVEASSLFDSLSMNEIVETTDTLWIAPNTFKSEVISEIEREINYHTVNGDGEITMKLNSMNDLTLMNKLVEASQKGVKVNLIIRGICCLRPQVEGYTENIKIKSIVGRYLEHSRIFRFGQKERAKLFIGSGDFLNRNTQRRVEAFIQVSQQDLKDQIHFILDTEIDDNCHGWQMNSDSTYTQLKGKHLRHSQDLIRNYYNSLSFQPVVVDKEKVSFWQALIKKLLG